MGFLDDYLNRSNFGDQSGGGILGMLLQNMPNLPPPGQQPQGWPAQAPTDVSAVNRNGTSGVTLPQTDASGFGRDGGSNPFASLFSGLGDAVGGLFGQGGQQAAQPQPGAQQAPQMPQGPGVLDRLSAGAGNFTTGGNPLAGIFNSIKGLATGERTDPAGLMQQNVLATYKALVSAGVPPGVAQAAAVNPKVLETIAPQLYSKPTLQETGADPLSGQKSFSWVQPDKMQTTPAIANGMPVGPNAAPGGQNMPPSMQQLFDQIGQMRSQGATQEQILQVVPNSIRSGVAAMLNGQSIPSNLSARGAARDLTLRIAHEVDPSFDESLIPARVALQKSYQGGGKNYQETLALNTVGGHLLTLKDAAEGLGNTGFKPWNTIKNMATDWTVGNPELVKFRNALVTTQNELAKAYHGGHVSDSAFNAFNNAINEAQTPAELKAAVGQLSNLLQSKITANESGYKSGMNGLPLPAQYRAINDEARHSFDAINKWVQGGQAASGNVAPGQQQAPQDAHAAAPLPAPDAQGWIALPNGIKIREKK